MTESRRDWGRDSLPYSYSPPPNPPSGTSAGTGAGAGGSGGMSAAALDSAVVMPTPQGMGGDPAQEC